MGDLLQLTPTLRALHAAFPEAAIDVLVGSAPAVDIFRLNPAVAATWVYDRKSAKPEHSSLFRLWRRLRHRSYDLVINYQRSNWRSWLLASAGVPCRFLVYHKTRGRVVHAVEDHLATIAPLGIAVADLRLELRYGDDDRRYAEQLWQEAGLNGTSVVALNPGASHPVNRWSLKNFAELADRLALLPDVRVILIGGQDDRSLAAEIVAMTQSKPLVLTGRTKLLQSGAVLDRCALLVSGDTGPMHLATAVGCRVLALFGAADPGRTGPVGAGHRIVRAEDLDCVPCRSRSCTAERHMECMERISVERVLENVREMITERAACAS